MTIGRIDALARRGAPDAPAIHSGAVTLTYAVFEARVAAEAGRLIGEGIAPGDRVAIWAAKTPGMVVALFAAWRAGAVAVPINPVLKPPQVAHILADSGAALLMTTPARATLVDSGALGAARPIAIDEAPAGPAGEGAATPSDLAAILYTSGSTGRPKGVMLSHANLWLAADSVATYLALRPDDVALAALPLSFDAGLSVVTSALMAGGSAALVDYLAPMDIVRAIERHGATTLSVVPPLWTQLEGAAWPAATTLRRITVTGGRMPVAATRALRARWPQVRLHLMYGLTEAFRSLELDPALVDAHPDSVGRAIPHARVHVVRPDGRPCDDGEPGELVHSGPLVARGYWRDAARTAERFRPFAGGIGVWSGDTVVRDAAGLHYFVGRDDEMIKVMSMRVSPTEIEEAAHATGAVADAVALGVADARLGQAIVLVAAPAPGLDEAAAGERLRAGLAETLPSHMRPARVDWRPALQRGPNGKLDRAAIRAGIA